VKKRFSEEQIIGFLKEVDAGIPVKELCLKRKKIPVGERQPLFRPGQADQVWSMDFVFDRSADGRVVKCLTVVDDATHQAEAIVAERAISGEPLRRTMDRICKKRGYPQIIRTDIGKEFCCRAMLSWCHAHGVKLLLIDPGMPNQNAYIESFNGGCGMNA